MKKKILIAIGIAIVIIIIPVILCSSPTEPAEDSIHLELIVEDNMTLDEVYNLMVPELKNAALIYPALDIAEVADGRWEFEAKANAEPGDTDAPYLVLVVFPQEQAHDDTEGFYMLFFKDEKLMDTARFDYDTAWAIQDKLWTAQVK